jgi:hypothetical protein
MTENPVLEAVKDPSSLSINSRLPFKLKNGELVDVSITSRSGVSALDLVDAFRMHIDALNAIREGDPKPAVPVAPPPVAKSPAPQYIPSDLPVPPEGKSWNIAEVCWVKILPQPEGKVNIEFYGNDRKNPHNEFPSIKITKWSQERAAKLLEGVTSAKVFTPAEFTLICKILWTEGNTYTTREGKTGHYKDVHHVIPA